MNKKLIIISICLLLFIPFLGYVHLFDWDEINFAESAREMIVSQDYLKVQINFKPFHEKPPFFIWLQTISMKILGINEFASRLPNALSSIIICLGLLAISKKISSEKLGIYWIISFLGSLLPFFYFKSGIIDPIFNLFIFFGIYFFYEFINSKNKISFIYSLILISLSVLTKGPVGLLIFSISLFIYLILVKKLKNNILPLIVIFILSLIPYTIWYFSAYGYSIEIIKEFISYHLRLMSTQDAGHSGPFFYHFIILIFGVFPASFFAISKIYSKKLNEFDILNLILLIVVLVIFSIVKTKIIHYSSLAYFPITYFSARYLIENSFSNKLKNIVFIFGLLIATSLIAFPFIIQFISNNPELIKDSFTKEVIKAKVNWNLFDSLPGLILFISICYFKFLKSKISIFAPFIGVALTLFFFLPIVAPKIESYTQKANIEFWQSKSKEDCFLMPLSYKSYSHYFYGNIKIDSIIQDLEGDDLKNHILTQKINKNAYFSVRHHQAESYINDFKLIKLYEKNGFVFLMRKSSN